MSTWVDGVEYELDPAYTYPVWVPVDTEAAEIRYISVPMSSVSQVTTSVSEGHTRVMATGASTRMVRNGAVQR